MRHALRLPLAGLTLSVALTLPAVAAPKPPALPLVENVDLQPLARQVKRLLEALDFIGQPLVTPADREKLTQALNASDAATAVRGVQEILDPYCLVGIHINPESRVKVAEGPVKPLLMQHGWRTFLIKVHNEAGVTAELGFESPNEAPVYSHGAIPNDPEPQRTISDADVLDRWLDAALFTDQPLRKTLSGLPLEYRIIQLYSRDAGQREALLSFHVGQGTQDLGFRSDVSILFGCVPSRKVTLRIKDHDGQPTMASLMIRDQHWRTYPSQTKRLAPDFFFQGQIYRADGETVLLAPGKYRIDYTRGPEYIPQVTEVVVAADDPDPVIELHLKRWIDLKKFGYYFGDHHIHAAGCAHYADPRQGVTPEDMMRHILGEDLNVGCVLSWGPCWYFQKTFFQGDVHPLSQPNYIMRYDVEVSGFPSDYAGHLCLIGLKEDDFPGTKRIEDWPSWDLPILKWARSQGAVVGFSHSGNGLATESRELPNYEIPPFNGIGANEYIVDVTHDAVDFISAVDTCYPYELNIWYHTNNAGFRCKLSGETDFPCIYGERVGIGRVYAKIDGKLAFSKFLSAIKAGRSYVCEGRMHLMDFQVNERKLGEEESELRLTGPGRVTVRVRAAGRLDEKPREHMRTLPIDHAPYWDIERARIPGTNRVPVEIVVNGRAVARKEIVADGTVHDLEFEVPIERSSWIAARVFASAHTNPIYVLVNDKPIRASRRSIQWCLDSVEQCWKSKSSANRLRDSEREACAKAYDHARAVYKARLAECEVD